MQRAATKLKDVAQLALLPESPKIISRPVSFDRIYQLTSTHDALMYACELARKSNGDPVVPKLIYGEMGRDKTVWSRITSGEFDLDGRDITRFNSVVGNSAYLLYLQHLDGQDLTSIRKTMDDKDREIAHLREQLAAERLRNQTIIEYERQKDARR
jgi:hypothetical protein